MVPTKEQKICYVCASDKFVDRHHYDCRGGTLRPETVPLCRRCHRSYHDWGIDCFSPDTTERILEVENKRRLICHLPLMSMKNIKRSNYWYKKHGIKREHPLRPKKDKVFPSLQLPFEPLSGWQWVNEHLNDLKDWVPRIEVTGPGLKLSMEVDNAAKLKEAIKAIRVMKLNNKGGLK